MIPKHYLIAWFAIGLATSSVFAQFDRLGDAVGDDYREKAEAGDAEAQFQLGLRVLQGMGGKNSSAAQGAMWIQKAAKQEHAKAMEVLAELYDRGEGVAKDPKLAFQWHQKAAEKDLPEAQVSVALAYLQGGAVEKDASMAGEWAQKAAAKGNSDGQAMYATMLLRGEGTPKNASKAAVWFLRAAQQNHANAQRQLAFLYYTGSGVPVDYKRCEAWYRQAASQNVPDAEGFKWAINQLAWAKNDLAWFLATCPDEAYHNGPEAVKLATDAAKLISESTNEQRHEVIDTIAAALARSGQFAEAVRLQRRCIQLVREDEELPEEDRKKLEGEFATRLKLYQEKKAYSDAPAKPEKKEEPLPNDRVLEEGRGSKSKTIPNGAPKQEKKKESVT